jgi:hypothetical protein
MSARATKFTNLAVSGNLTVGGTTVTSGVVSDDLTMAAGKILATDADKLKAGGKIIPQTFLVTRAIFDGATLAAFDGVIPIPVACKLVSIKLRFQTTSSVGGATLMAYKVPSGTAKASGTALLSAGMALDGTADTNVTGTLSATPADYTFAAGDGLGFIASTAPTALDGVGITAEFARV